jgi:flagellar biogenesis protein FliO
VEIVGLGRVLGALVFVLVMFFAFVALLKRYRGQSLASQPGAIKLVDQLALDIGRRAVLLEVDNKRSLVVLSKESSEHLWTEEVSTAESRRPNQ